MPFRQQQKPWTPGRAFPIEVQVTDPMPDHTSGAPAPHVAYAIRTPSPLVQNRICCTGCDIALRKRAFDYVSAVGDQMRAAEGLRYRGMASIMLYSKEVWITLVI